MSDSVFAVLNTPREANLARQKLMEDGLAPGLVIVCSTEPPPQGELVDGSRTYLPLFAILGGLLGATAGYLLTSLTATAMNLPVGGQPIVSLWAFAVIIFEFAALGTIGGTVAAFLLESGLPRLGGRLYDGTCAEDLAKGGWLLGVRSSERPTLEKAGRILEQTGAREIHGLVTST